MLGKTDGFFDCCAAGFVLLVVFGAPFLKWVAQYYKMQSESAAKAAARRSSPAQAPQGRRFVTMPPAPPAVPFQTRVAKREQPPVLTPVFEDETPLAAVGSLESRHVVDDHVDHDVVQQVESEIVRHSDEYMKLRGSPRAQVAKVEARKRRVSPVRAHHAALDRIEEEYSVAERGLIWHEILGPPPGLVRWRNRGRPSSGQR